MHNSRYADIFKHKYPCKNIFFGHFWVNPVFRNRYNLGAYLYNKLSMSTIPHRRQLSKEFLRFSIFYFPLFKIWQIEKSDPPLDPFARFIVFSKNIPIRILNNIQQLFEPHSKTWGGERGPSPYLINDDNVGRHTYIYIGTPTVAFRSYYTI